MKVRVRKRRGGGRQVEVAAVCFVAGLSDLAAVDRLPACFLLSVFDRRCRSAECRRVRVLLAVWCVSRSVNGRKEPVSLLLSEAGAAACARQD